MIGHTDGSVLNNDSKCPGHGSRTPAVRARSSSSQPITVGSAAGRSGWSLSLWLDRTWVLEVIPNTEWSSVQSDSEAWARWRAANAASLVAHAGYRGPCHSRLAGHTPGGDGQPQWVPGPATPGLRLAVTRRCPPGARAGAGPGAVAAAAAALPGRSGWHWQSYALTEAQLSLFKSRVTTSAPVHNLHNYAHYRPSQTR